MTALGTRVPGRGRRSGCPVLVFGSAAKPDHVTHVWRLLHKLYIRLESPRM